MSPQLFVEKVRRRLFHISIRLLQLPRIIKFRLISRGHVVGRPILYQPLQIVGSGVVEFSGKVSIGVFPSPFFFSSYSYIEARHSTATVTIGDGTWINNGFSAIAEHNSISIGKRVLIGTKVEIFDSDFHAINFTDRGKSTAGWAKPVVIEDDVFLGSNVRVMKGVTIGMGSVVANSSVVTKDVPPGVIVGGNPARVIRMIV